MPQAILTSGLLSGPEPPLDENMGEEPLKGEPLFFFKLIPPIQLSLWLFTSWLPLPPSEEVIQTSNKALYYVTLLTLRSPETASATTRVHRAHLNETATDIWI